MNELFKRIEGTVLDPNTKRSVAFYSSLAVTCFDVITKGMNATSGMVLLSLAGIAAYDVASK